MLILYLVLAVLGVGLTIAHARRRTGRTWLAALGTVLAGLAVLSGFSIGLYVAAAAAVVLVVAVVQLRPRDPVA